MDDTKKYTDEDLKAAYFLGVLLEKQCDCEPAFINIAISNLPMGGIQQKLSPLIDKHVKKTAIIVKALENKINSTITNNSKINN